MDYQDILTFDSNKTGLICHYQGKKYELPLDYDYFLQCFKGSENFYVVFTINNAHKYKIQNKDEYSYILQNFKKEYIELQFNQKDIVMDRTKARKRSQDRAQIVKHTQYKTEANKYILSAVRNDKSQGMISLMNKKNLSEDKIKKEQEEINSKINNLVDRILKLEEEKIYRNDEIDKLKTSLIEKENIIQDLVNKHNLMEQKMKHLETELCEVKLNIKNNGVEKEIIEEPKEVINNPPINENIIEIKGEFGDIIARLDEEFNVTNIFTKKEIDNAIMKGKYDYEMVKHYLFYN